LTAHTGMLNVFFSDTHLMNVFFCGKTLLLISASYITETGFYLWETFESGYRVQVIVLKLKVQR